MIEYDIIVAGCGTGGAAAAIAAAKAGLKVLVVESKPRDDIGRKVCGDGIHVNHYQFVKELGIEFSERELLRKITGMRIVAPNRVDAIHVKDDGYCINRRLFGQKLLEGVENAGAKVRAKCAATGLIVKDGTVTGVTTDSESFSSKIVIDATGVAGVLRKQIPFDTDFPKVVDPQDFAKGYREVVEINGKFDYPDDIVIEYNNEVAPYGYIWYFPKSETVLNIGLGFKGPNDLNEMYRKHVSSHFNITKVLDAGGYPLPMVRKPFDGYVANGFMIVGDAACQVNPLDGAGIGYSIRGGVTAARAALNCVDYPTRENLWQYNKNFMTDVGAKHAQSAIFARALGSLTNDDINFVFKKGLITSGDIKQAYTGNLKLGIASKLVKAIKGSSRPYILKTFNTVAKLTSEVKDHYMNYPSDPGNFMQWRIWAKTIFDQAERSF